MSFLGITEAEVAGAVLSTIMALLFAAGFGLPRKLNVWCDHLLMIHMRSPWSELRHFATWVICLAFLFGGWPIWLVWRAIENIHLDSREDNVEGSDEDEAY